MNIFQKVWQLMMPRRKPSVEVEELKEHLKRAKRDDIKITNQTMRKEKLIRDNHLVADVERALGLRP